MSSSGYEFLYLEHAPVAIIVLDVTGLEQYLAASAQQMSETAALTDHISAFRSAISKISMIFINDKCRELLDIGDDTPDYNNLNSLVNFEEFLSSDKNALNLFGKDEGEGIIIPIHTFRGVDKVVSLSWKTLTGTEGNRFSILSLHDITKLKTVEQDLVKKEKRLKYTEAVAHLGNYEIYMDTGTASWSDETFRIFDLDPLKDKEPTVESYLSLVHPDDLELFNKTISVTLSEKKSFNLVYRIITPAGNLKYLHSVCYPQLDESGEVKMLAGTIQDVTHMKLTEDTLLEFQNRFSLFNEMLFDWIVMFRVEENFKLKREWGIGKFDEVSGYTAEERENLGGMLSLVHPDDLKMYKKYTEDLFIKGEQPYIDFRIVRKNGEIVWTRNYTRLLKSPDGKITHIVGAGKDITDIRASEEKVRESEERLRRAEEIAGFGYFSFDFTLNMVTLSEGAKKIYGISSGESLFSMESTLQYLDEKTRTIAAELYETIKTGNQPDPFELRITLPEGTPKNLMIYPADFTKDKEGKAVKLFGAMFDLTQIRNTEEKLRISEVNFRNIFEMAPFTLAITDIESGRILNANRFAKAYYGVDDFEGMKTAVFYKDPSERTRMLEELKRDGSIQNFEIEIINFRGETRWVAISGRVVEYMGKKCLLNAQYDITDQKNALELMKIAKQRAEEANRVKTNFLANMSHELRTPLIGIVGFTEILQEELKDENHLRMISRISKGANRLHSTVNLILDLAKLEKSDIRPVLARTDLFTVIENVITVHKSFAQEKNLYLRIVKNSGEAVSDIDSTLMGDIFNHLINNALKYTFQGGVTISVSEVEDQEGTWNSVSVKDTGIGLKKEETEKIFDDFIQVSEGYSRRFEGTGLGLTLVKRYTELMGGRLSLFSAPGEGSEFIVQFRSSRSSRSSGRNSDNAASALKKKILYVEDDDVAIDLVTRFLNAHFEVEFAVNSDAALRMAEENNYEGFLIDINLGRGMDGYGVTKALRGIPRYKNVPVVAVTAYAMSGDEEDALKAGCSGYISKPFTKRDFTEYVLTAFGLLQKSVLPENAPD
ncbi:MAG: PAS domain-containing protein [Ignavibacteriaceae bacterium]|nr:PAS domain-containing protein [Ignavibacteriaceae bacterium]